MRLTSVFQVECDCGETVEFPDSLRQVICPKCGRALIVAAWPNDPPMTIQTEGKRT